MSKGNLPNLPNGTSKVFFHLRDDRMVTGGQGVPLRVHVRGSEIKEQVAEQRPDALRKENLETEDERDNKNALIRPHCSQQQYIHFWRIYPTVALELTIVQPIWGPRSLKYKVTVVPTGKFCKMSSSLRAFSSATGEGMLPSASGFTKAAAETNKGDAGKCFVGSLFFFFSSRKCPFCLKAHRGTGAVNVLH